LITVPNFRRVKDRVRKKIRKGQGLEFLLQPARAMTGVEIAKWFGDLREAYRLCQSLGAQFILSSGAGSPSEMISGISFDEVLKEVGIEPKRHWDEQTRWLEDALAGQVTVQ
jgi:RNase P/RNase MRP subunit p30